MSRSVWKGSQLRAALESAAVGLLLFSVVASSIAGSEAMLFSTVLAAWVLFPLLVGFRYALDAGCAFMLISLGVVVVVGVAQNGLDALFPYGGPSCARQTFSTLSLEKPGVGSGLDGRPHVAEVLQFLQYLAGAVWRTRG